MSTHLELEFHTVVDSPDIGRTLVRLRTQKVVIARQFRRADVDDHPELFGSSGTPLMRVEEALKAIYDRAGADGLLTSAAWAVGMPIK